MSVCPRAFSRVLEKKPGEEDNGLVGMMALPCRSWGCPHCCHILFAEKKGEITGVLGRIGCPMYIFSVNGDDWESRIRRYLGRHKAQYAKVKINRDGDAVVASSVLPPNTRPDCIKEAAEVVEHMVNALASVPRHMRGIRLSWSDNLRPQRLQEDEDEWEIVKLESKEEKEFATYAREKVASQEDKLKPARGMKVVEKEHPEESANDTVKRFLDKIAKSKAAVNVTADGRIEETKPRAKDEPVKAIKVAEPAKEKPAKKEPIPENPVPEQNTMDEFYKFFYREDVPSPLNCEKTELSGCCLSWFASRTGGWGARGGVVG